MSAIGFILLDKELIDVVYRLYRGSRIQKFKKSDKIAKTSIFDEASCDFCLAGRHPETPKAENTSTRHTRHFHVASAADPATLLKESALSQIRPQFPRGYLAFCDFTKAGFSMTSRVILQFSIFTIFPKRVLHERVYTFCRLMYIFVQ